MSDQNNFFEIVKNEAKNEASGPAEEEIREASEVTKAEEVGSNVQEVGKTDSGEEQSGKKKKQKKDEKPLTFWGEVWEWVKVLVIAAVCAFLINNFIISNTTVPTGSMENTIMTGARVFGSRLDYTFGDVKRGDVAIFVYGYRCKKDGQMYRENEDGACPLCGRKDKDNSVVYYVKRIIGMPGDHVEIRQTGFVDASEITKFPVSSATGKIPVGTVYVNGEPITETYLAEPMIVDPNVEVNASGDNVMFPPVDVTVPEGSYYCLGDNRNNSEDARYWGKNNFVSRDKMVAKVYFKYWPLNDIGVVK